MTYPGDPKRLRRRAPGAEHPVKVRKVGVNPLRLTGLTVAQVAAVVGAASARAIQRTVVEHHRGKVAPAPGAGLEERIR